MNLQEIKEQVLFQAGSDAAELGDFMPHLLDYINDGYDRLAAAVHGEHLSPEHETLFPLRHDKDLPALPAWTHSAVADWATWLIYRNGGSSRQNRGYVFRSGFENVEKKLHGAAASKQFIHLPG